MGLFIQCDTCLKMVKCGFAQGPGWRERKADDDGRVYGHECPQCIADDADVEAERIEADT